MVTRLLDANVLIALFEQEHIHHSAVREWFLTLEDTYATCPIVEGALTRWIVRLEPKAGATVAVEELNKLANDPRHRFWPDDLGYAGVNFRGVLGHRQVTDAYLATLARKHGGGVVTLDQSLAALHDDVAELIST